MKKQIISLFLAAALTTSLLPAAPWAAAAAAGETASAQESGFSAHPDRDGSAETETGPMAESAAEPEDEIVAHFHTNAIDQEWLDHLHLPDYALDLYSILVRESEEEHLSSDILAADSSFTLRGKQNEHTFSQVSFVEVVDYEEPLYLADQALPVTGHTLGQEHIYILDAKLGDKAVDYGALSEGSVVKTSSFNGVCITSVTRTGNPNFDADLAAAREYVLAACRAFDRTHPEVFWLSGHTRLRIDVAEITTGGQTVQKAFFFYVLADDSGFTVRDSAYSGFGAIQAGIQRRDDAIRTILAAVPKSGEEAQVKALNAWLTQHNEYNTSTDLNAIGIDSRHCLGALTGSVGTRGPVCEGYSKAFKVLCDQLGIPCLLETGYAGTNRGMGLHMWNEVEMPDRNWYGADITWDDPVVAGVTGARSGRENEKYLLVGNGTVIDKLRFDASHQAEPENQNPQLSAGAYVGGSTVLGDAPVPLGSLPTGAIQAAVPGSDLPPGTVQPVVSGSDLSAGAVQPAPGQPFNDVPAGAYYADAVGWALKKGITAGISPDTFAPNAGCSRGQVVTFLWRAMGKPAPKRDANPFTDVKSGDYFRPAILWAVEQGITTGTASGTFSPERPCTRGQVITFLWRTLGKPENKGSSLWYADAVNWAERHGLLAGTAQAFTPDGACPRADIITYLYRALNQ